MQVMRADAERQGWVDGDGSMKRGSEQADARMIEAEEAHGDARGRYGGAEQAHGDARGRYGGAHMGDYDRDAGYGQTGYDGYGAPGVAGVRGEGRGGGTQMPRGRPS
jgi:hypothetical protein